MNEGHGDEFDLRLDWAENDERASSPPAAEAVKEPTDLRPSDDLVRSVTALTKVSAEVTTAGALLGAATRDASGGGTDLRALMAAVQQLTAHMAPLAELLGDVSRLVAEFAYRMGPLPDVVDGLREQAAEISDAAGAFDLAVDTLGQRQDSTEAEMSRVADELSRVADEVAKLRSRLPVRAASQATRAPASAPSDMDAAPESPAPAFSRTATRADRPPRDRPLRAR